MFLLLLILIVAGLLATGHAPDQYGWMMLLSLGWVGGYLDCRFFARSDRDKDRVMPPDIHEPSDDRTTFES
jgi:hypothetical protein